MTDTSATRLDDPGPDLAEDCDGPVQLGLFSPEQQEVEAAWAALGRLELDRAESLFSGALDRDPESEPSRRGVDAVAYWRAAIEGLAGATALERASSLWQAVSRCPPGMLSRPLRRRLLTDVLEPLEMHPGPLPLPELCAGDVLLALGREGSARAWLEWAVRHEPCAARLQLLLGDACWLTGAAGPARASYSRGLLLDPTLERWHEVAWVDLRRRIQETGGARAAVELWAEGGLPLPPTTSAGRPHPAVAEVWRVLADAADAAAHRRHDETVHHRLRLQSLDPDIFARYMERLEG